MVFPGAISSNFINNPRVAPMAKNERIENRYNIRYPFMISGKDPGKDSFIFSFILQITGFRNGFLSIHLFAFLKVLSAKMPELKILRLQ